MPHSKLRESRIELLLLAFMILFVWIANKILEMWVRHDY